jgi:hypothetical protein
MIQYLYFDYVDRSSKHFLIVIDCIDISSFYRDSSFTALTHCQSFLIVCLISILYILSLFFRVIFRLFLFYIVDQKIFIVLVLLSYLVSNCNPSLFFLLMSLCCISSIHISIWGCIQQASEASYNAIFWAKSCCHSKNCLLNLFLSHNKLLFFNNRLHLLFFSDLF